MIATARQLRNTRPWLGAGREAGAGLGSQADEERWLGRQRVTVSRNFLVPADCRQPVESCSGGFFNPSDRFLNTFPRTKSSRPRREAVFLHATDRTAALDAQPAHMASPQEQALAFGIPNKSAPRRERARAEPGDEASSSPALPVAPGEVHQIPRERMENQRPARFWLPGVSQPLLWRAGCRREGRHGLQEQRQPRCVQGRHPKQPRLPPAVGAAPTGLWLRSGAASMPGGCGPPPRITAPIAREWLLVRAPEPTCRQSCLAGLHQDTGGKHVGVTSSRGFAKVEGKKKLKITLYLCFAHSLLSFYF